MLGGGAILGGGGVGVKSVQAGTIAITNVALTNTAAVTAVDTANAILIHLGTTTSQALGKQDITSVRLTLTSGTVVTATRGAANSSAETITVSYLLIEFVPGFLKSLQYKTIDLNGLTTNTVALTAVDVTKTFVILLGMTTTDNTNPPTFDTFGWKVVLTSSVLATASRQTSTAFSFIIGFVVCEVT